MKHQFLNHAFCFNKTIDTSVRVILKLSISKYILKEDTYAKHKKLYREQILRLKFLFSIHDFLIAIVNRTRIDEFSSKFRMPYDSYVPSNCVNPIEPVA